MHDARAYMPESASTEWGTTHSIFDPLHHAFNITVDVAARPWNAKVPTHFFTPELDGLRQPWTNEIAWCNPPYGAKTSNNGSKKPEPLASRPTLRPAFNATAVTPV